MARSTQLRLDAITGSLSAIDGVTASRALPAAIGAEDLQAVLGQFAGAIKRIHGDAAFTNQEAGKFVHATSQFVGDVSGSANLKVSGHITGSANVLLDQAGGAKIKVPGGMLAADIFGGFEVGMSNLASESVVFKFAGAEKFSVSKEGNTAIKGTLDVDGQATLATALVENMTTTDGALVFHNASKVLGDNSSLTFDGSDLKVPGLKDASLTASHVVFAGVAGELVGEAAFSYNAGSNVLSISGSQFGHSVTVGQDLTVAGDLKVQGAMTYLDTQNLLVKDAKIVISSGTLVNGAGIYLADESAGENIRWSTDDGGKWIASDMFAADTLQALDLSSAIVWADATGSLVEISNADLGAAINGRLAEGTGVDFSLNAGTGVTTISIGQEVYTTSSVTFAGVTGSNLTANRLMRSDASSVMVSAGLIDFVSGTHLSVTADAAGGAVWALPQAIYTASAPQFSALNIGTAHDLLDDGSGNLKLETTGYIKFDDAEGAYELAKSGEYALFDAKFTATSIVGALVELANGGGGGKGKEVVAIASDVTAVAGKYPVVLASLDLAPLADAATAEKRLDVYLNGQLMVQASDYSVVIADDKLNFEFPLKADDVVVAIVR